MIFVTIGGQVPSLQQTNIRSHLLVEGGVLVLCCSMGNGLLCPVGLGWRDDKAIRRGVGGSLNVCCNTYMMINNLSHICLGAVAHTIASHLTKSAEKTCKLTLMAKKCSTCGHV